MVPQYEVFNATPISKNKHSVVLLSSTRPENTQGLVKYYNDIADNFARQYQCALLKVDEVRLNPFRESALIFITVSTKKKRLAKMYELNRLFNKPF